MTVAPPPGYSRQQTAAPPPPAGYSKATVGLGEDLARTVPSAVKRGAEQTIGTIGDVAGMGGAGASKAASLFVQPEAAKTTGDAVSEAIGTALNPVGSGISKIAQALGFGEQAKRAYMPTSESIKQDVEAAVPASKSLNYDPQTLPGKLLHTGIEFGTGAIAGEARLPAILRRVAEQMGIGMLSEGAGQATEGTALEPYARVGTGLGLSALTLSPLLRKGPVAAAGPDWIGGQPTPSAEGLSAGQATGNKGLQAVEKGMSTLASAAKDKAVTALTGGLLAGHLPAVAAGLAAPIGGNMLLRSGPVQRMLMSAPATDRAALTAIISGQQSRKQGQEGWR